MFILPRRTHLPPGQVTKRDFIKVVAALRELRDQPGGHAQPGVTVLCRHTCHRLGVSAETVEVTILASRLYDIGNLSLPDSARYVHGDLDDMNRLLMQSHTVVGADLLSSIRGFRHIAPTVRAHHERWDGTGYPDELSGTAIPIGARIIAVVDSFQAMITARPYRLRMSVTAAIEELRQDSGTKFDPDVVTAFISMNASPGDPKVAEEDRKDNLRDL